MEATLAFWNIQSLWTAENGAEKKWLHVSWDSKVNLLLF
jgi:hypothetical protein